MDYPVPAPISTSLIRHPFCVWLLLMLLFGGTALVLPVLDRSWCIVLVCLSFMLKGQLVIDYLMGLKAAPRHLRWPMLLYFYVFSTALLIAFQF